MYYFATLTFFCFSLALFWEVHKPKSTLSLFLNYFPKVKAVVSDGDSETIVAKMK